MSTTSPNPGAKELPTGSLTVEAITSIPEPSPAKPPIDIRSTSSMLPPPVTASFTPSSRNTLSGASPHAPSYTSSTIVSGDVGLQRNHTIGLSQTPALPQRPPGNENSSTPQSLTPRAPAIVPPLPQSSQASSSITPSASAVATLPLARPSGGISQSAEAGPSRTPLSATPTPVQTPAERPRHAPPYPPPVDVIYPSEARLNPHVGSMDPQPVYKDLHPGTLFRPAYLPPDLDERIDSSSVWIGIESSTSKAIYFVPPACLSCTRPSVNSHCDRASPKCGRCVSKNLDCVRGAAWRMLKPRYQRTKAEQKTTNGLTATSKDKEKGRATDHGDAVNGEERTEGKNKRVRKKRRLSASNEIDPNEIDDDGVQTKKAVRRVTSKVSLPLARMDPPYTADDRAYFARIEANALKPPLISMKGPCSVWADKRRALLSAVEYFRQPVKSVGASVEIGPGGIARGVILEGQAPGQGNFWGQGAEAGTIITSIGHARPLAKSISYKLTNGSRPSQPEPLEPYVRATSPPINLLPNIIHTDTKSPEYQASAPEEAIEIAGLLMAQRARTPIAIAAAQDYSAAPFKIPRRFVVLGWFWVTDAWLEPVIPGLAMFTEKQTPPDRSPELASWKFRFEWCQPQATPWWCAKTDPDRPTSAGTGVEYSKLGWQFDGPGTRGTSTVNNPPKSTAEAQPGVQSRFPAGEEKWWHTCQMCNTSSRRVYAQGDICLNEACPWFFGDASKEDSHVGPSNNQPHALQPMERISPQAVGLQLRPPEPNAKRIEVLRSQAGKEFWRGWVCHKCGSAGERRKWREWDCEACTHIVHIPRKIYDVEYLRSPSRPISTGPRHTDGYPHFPYNVGVGWTLFQDDVKVIKHTVDSVDGRDDAMNGLNLFHALNTEGRMAHVAAGVVLRGLQLQGSSEVSFRRQIQPFTTNRPAEKYLSPFYTYLCGPEPFTPIDHLPTGPAMPWKKVPNVCLDTADLINERAGRMWPGQRERFNSLLIAAFPPGLPASLQPHVTVEAGSYYAFLFLGSDGGLRLRPASSGRPKFVELAVQHGDVVGIKAGSTPIEAVLKMDGFGFVGIGRQAYRLIEEPSLPEIDTAEFPALALPPRSYPRAGVARTIKPIIPKLETASLDGWYIGPRPLDPKARLRIRGSVDNTGPPAFPSSHIYADGSRPEYLNVDYEKENTATQARWTGVIGILQDLPPLNILAPPPGSPSSKKKALLGGVIDSKAPRKPRKRPNEDIRTPDAHNGDEITPSGKGRKKAKRESIVETEVKKEEASEAGDVVMVMGTSPAVRGGQRRSGNGRGGSARGKAKGKERSSLGESVTAA